MVENAAEKFGFSPQEERKQSAHLPYFGGALSVDGTMSMTIRHGRGNSVTVAPFVVFSSTSSEKLQVFESVFRAKIKNVGNSNSYLASWPGYKSASIGVRLLEEKVAPSREETLLGFQNWTETEDVDERIEIAENLRQSDLNRHIQIDYAIWSQLLDNKQFAGGVISRASFRFHEQKNGSVSVRLEIISRNVSMLDSLEKYFGGKVTRNIGKDRIVQIRDVEYISKKGFSMWEINSEAAGEVLNYVKGDLGFELPEDWQEKLPKKVKETEEAKTQTRVAIIQNLLSYIDGKEFILKSVTDFVKDSKLSEATVIRIIDGLPDDQKKMRSKFLRDQRSHITKEKEQQLILEMIKELKDYSLGKIK